MDKKALDKLQVIYSMPYCFVAKFIIILCQSLVVKFNVWKKISLNIF